MNDFIKVTCRNGGISYIRSEIDNCCSVCGQRLDWIVE